MGTYAATAERHVEIDADENGLTLRMDVGDGLLGRGGDSCG
jgi:hypothetical protein